MAGRVSDRAEVIAGSRDGGEGERVRDRERESRAEQSRAEQSTAAQRVMRERRGTLMLFYSCLSDLIWSDLYI
jgi:hypothetical protein